MKIKNTVTHFLEKSLNNLYIAVGYLIGTENIRTNAEYIETNDNNYYLKVCKTVNKEDLKIKGSNMTIKEIRNEINNICLELKILLTNIDYEEDVKRLHATQGNKIVLSPLRLNLDKTRVNAEEILNQGDNNDN